MKEVPLMKSESHAPPECGDSLVPTASQLSGVAKGPVLLLAVILAGVLTSPASAAVITETVTTLSDNLAGSLRAALVTANADPNNSYVINFSVAGGGTLALAADASGARMLPILTNPSGISIDGANGGQGAITIDGGSTSATTGDRIFFIGIPAGTPSHINGVNI